MRETYSATHRLASYGSLAPGRENAGQLDALKGTWTKGIVHGRLVKQGWGHWIGYPGAILSTDGEPIEVLIFTSHDLPDHWDRLDAFEGEGYRRVVAPATLESGDVIDVSIYEVRATG
ncbi:MAG: gamma-glutamylcyclotransferase family protein [Pseudomonadota bacterium]